MTAKRPARPGAKGVDRRSAYRHAFAGQARTLCGLGATDAELAEFFKVSRSTLSQWKIAHPAFTEALKVGKDEADDRVERSLYQMAVGYTFESEKIFCHEGVVTRAPTVEHVPPSTTAQIFWLKNRRRDLWRDKHDHEVTGKNGGPIDVIQRTIVDPAADSNAG